MAQSIQVKKVGWWHERLADYMIAYPEKTLGEIAKHFGRSQVWISIVKNSDVFIDYWQTRSAEHGKAVTAGVKEKAYAAAELALDELNDRLESPLIKVMPVQQLLDIQDMTLKRFGYGAGKDMPSTQVNLVFPGQVTSSMLEEARSKMRQQQEGSKVIELHPVKLEDQASGD